MGNGEKLAAVVCLLLGLGVGAYALTRPKSERSEGSAKTSNGKAPGRVARVETISTGEQVEIREHLYKGVTTVVEFTAEW